MASEKVEIASSRAPGRTDVVIVGAGFAGMYLLFQLRKLGMSVVVIEAAADVGGTWYYNRYPGCRCDVESLQYSYSFSGELDQEWNWTERYATQPEILSYARHVADRFDLRRDIAFGTRVTSAIYDAPSNLWKITTDRAEVLTARFCVMATGCLSMPRKPEIPGVDQFKGDWYHTGQWPHENVDFTGKRVGIIGTGSTGIQLIPQVAKHAKQLYVFQRTPAYSLPAQNRRLDAVEKSSFRAQGKQSRETMRASPAGTLHTITSRSVLSVPTQEREQILESLWNEGGAGMMFYFSDVAINEEANEVVADFVRRKIRSIVKDPKTAQALTPYEYPIGAKRICIDIDYFETFNRDNVALVSLDADPVKCIYEDGVRTASGDWDLDCLIFATGYDALTGALLGIDIRGRDGRQLRDKWQAGPRTYLGVATAGFPNLFLVTGPGSPSVLSNMLVSIEQHVEWIADCLGYLRGRGLDRIDALLDYEDRWVAHATDIAEQTLFKKAASWYMGANVPGKPRVFMPYCGGVGAYRDKCAQIAANGYEGFEVSSAK